jgi:hypothetical protein
MIISLIHQELKLILNQTTKKIEKEDFVKFMFNGFLIMIVFLINN